jgi:hypothetical protein
MATQVTSQSGNDALRQKLRSTTEGLIKQYFGPTLGTVSDMTNIFMALMYQESTFNVNAEFSTPLSPITSSGAADYYNSSAIQSLFQGNPSDQRLAVIYQNEPQGRTAIGLTQVMGWNIIKGASKSGKCVVEQFRPDLASILCINPGESVRAKLLGEANMSNSILAGLVVLESKWKAIHPSGSDWSIKVGGKTLLFPSRIYGAVAGYLGYSGSDANGTTYTKYANAIIGGSMYAAANGPVAPSVGTARVQTAAVAAKGPLTIGGVGKIPGCVAKAAG